VLGGAVGAGLPGEGDARDDARDPAIGKSQGERLLKAVLALDAVRWKREVTQTTVTEGAANRL
jgi:hypothetical protein